ncbi:hypothetical protein, variant 7 [Phytophthora nicotianae P1976]|uniref:ISXO2-like transposase domain-containing protein n=1 Tax=Phytophthora nicotianae P1976 TaxID=1317066 RepID=A0A080YWU1_PHYNI|nr:hypothetical protein, variant 4 [Phytophthora nicotianae P1976]ETO58853.1 hypothetical protein, variant 5 [Phytophthora nicotianae P1976]ETO58854.1 hypothetical protein, variant 6 [Phytophthora nicotianae P1976]ETO58855.1 hypothetical protein, variant 7 [Phytophthora nicotianae P1976]
MPGTRTAARHASRNSYRPSLRSVVKITVEIDQTSLAKKRMYNRGCCCQECWLFGGIERRTGFTVGRIVYDKRTKQAVLPIITTFIKSRTKIMSDIVTTYVLERGDKQHTFENNRHLCLCSTRTVG